MIAGPVLPNTAKLDVPAALLPYQQKWIQDDSQLKVAEKSRRIGLTWAEAADDTLTAAAAKNAGGQNIYYIGYNQDMALEFVEACAMWARNFNRAASEIEEGIWTEDQENRSIKTYVIRFPESGHRITALSSRPANLRGKQGVVVIDEAAFHDQLGELLKAAVALLIWGGRVRIISTHDGDENPFNELIGEIRSGKRKGSVHRTEFAEAVEQGLYRRVCLRLGIEWSEIGEKGWVDEVYDFYGDDAAEELDVIPSQGSGTFLTRALIETCLSPDIPILRYEQTTAFAEVADKIRYAEVKDWCEENLAPLLDNLNPDLSSVFGEDFGRSGDLSVFLPLIEQQNVEFHCPFMVELRNMPFQQQEQILFYIVSRLPRFRFGALDARGNGQYLAERAMQKFGATRIAQVMLSETWYRENMPVYKAAFEDRTILLPRDKDVIDDNRAFKVIRGVARLPDTKNTGQDKKKRHGDTGIAGALAVFAARQDVGGPVEYKSAGKRRFCKRGTF